MKSKILHDMTCTPTEAYPDGLKPAGTIIDHPQAAILVQMGVAEPVDEECRKACNMTDAQIEAAKAAYPKVAAGIHPDDSEAYDRGEMIGYNPDGSWIPGSDAPTCDEDEDIDDDSLTDEFQDYESEEENE